MLPFTGDLVDAIRRVAAGGSLIAPVLTGRVRAPRAAVYATKHLGQERPNGSRS